MTSKALGNCPFCGNPLELSVYSTDTSESLDTLIKLACPKCKIAATKYLGNICCVTEIYSEFHNTARIIKEALPKDFSSGPTRCYPETRKAATAWATTIKQVADKHPAFGGIYTVREISEELWYPSKPALPCVVITFHPTYSRGEQPKELNLDWYYSLDSYKKGKPDVSLIIHRYYNENEPIKIIINTDAVFKKLSENERGISCSGFSDDKIIDLVMTFLCYPAKREDVCVEILENLGWDIDWRSEYAKQHAETAEAE